MTIKLALVSAALLAVAALLTLGLAALRRMRLQSSPRKLKVEGEEEKEGQEEKEVHRSSLTSCEARVYR